MNKDRSRITDFQKFLFLNSPKEGYRPWEKGDISVGISTSSRRRRSEIKDIKRAKELNFSKRVQEMEDPNAAPLDKDAIGVDSEHEERIKTETGLKRFEGCLLGGAVGDALGAPIEFSRLSSIRTRYGYDGLKDYVPAFGKIGAITDDTQMTLFTAEGLLRGVVRFRERGICSPQHVIYNAYLRWLQTQGHIVRNETSDLWVYRPNSWVRDLPEMNSLRAPGNTCMEALMSGEMGTTENRINDSKGCGGVMRVAPIGLIALDPFGLAVKAAAITHGHPSGYLSAGVFALIIGQVVNGSSLRDAINKALFEELPKHEHHGETLIACRKAIDLADSVMAEENGTPTAEMVESLGGGWVGEEALAIAIFCSLVHENDFEKAIILSVNHSGDSDSTGSMTGNILGALHGVDVIPQRWLEPLELRDAIKEMAVDLATVYRDDRQWKEKYPGI